MPEFSGISRPAVLRLAIACDFGRVREAAQIVRRFLAKQGCDEEVLMACDLALVEGCNNAIKHAASAARAQPVKLEAMCSPAEVELRITDHTPGFTWPKSAELPDSESESGRGLYLMQSLMTATDYLRGSEENVLVLRKARPPGGVPSAPQLAQELEIARMVQQASRPNDVPQLRGLEVAAFCRSAQELGGDFYHVVGIDNHTMLLAIADVMGKGVVAAIFAGVLRTVLRGMPELTRDPAALLSRLNGLLFDELSRADLFITAQLACFDVLRRELTVASAGHCPLLLAGGHDSEVRSYAPEGMPLGILPDSRFGCEIVKFPENCRVLLYTDGIIEAANGEGDRFGTERLAEWLSRRGAGRTAAELSDDLARTMKEFRANGAADDDQTFLIAATETGPET